VRRGACVWVGVRGGVGVRVGVGVGVRVGVRVGGREESTETGRDEFVSLCVGIDKGVKERGEDDFSSTWRFSLSFPSPLNRSEEFALSSSSLTDARAISSH
jgi:hypothetical protein